MRWTDFALDKAGAKTIAEFQSHYGLPETGEADLITSRALWDYLVGYRCHRMAPRETLYQVAQAYGTTIQAIWAGNCGLPPGGPVPGQLIRVPIDCPVVPWNAPFESAMEEVFLEGLHARCRWISSAPLATTAGGRRLWVIRLGTGGRRVLLTAGHHGNEWITSLLLWRLLEDYVTALREEGQFYGMPARSLFRRTTLCLVPLVNPDGADLVLGRASAAEVARARVLAASQPQVPFPRGWKANGAGVDLNLNYPARWEQAREIKAAAGVTAPGPRDYPGAEPLDQPETRALYDLTRRFAPHTVAAWHAQGGEIYAADPEGMVPDSALAERLAAASGYHLTSPPPESANGGYRDWFMAEYRRPGFTIEAGRGENPLPQRDLPALYEENLPIFAQLLAGG
ncbi:MAG TPA: LysM peptidoglycan-binding domain-containing protein [Candidatus Avoscillospira avicola]|uniref:LysM peptidoglycan-binding domain-containing protein n=1 Tax=Candidatus Avoscillospira avicola TaxID=2840706 RepID=A0A9D1DGI5_9FIRM|nr:LysM peptidoglycan-binding domain-containing protein [Candidatus Avoscillospira avicola]